MFARHRLAILCEITLLLNSNAGLRAQTVTEPSAYSITSTKTNGDDTFIRKTYRDGPKIVMEVNGGSGPTTTHTWSLLDLNTHQVLTWFLADKSTFCHKNSFDSWEFAPFRDRTAELAELNAKQVGTEIVDGFPAKVFEYPRIDGKVRMWIDARSNFLLKTQVIFTYLPAAGGGPEPPLTTYEVTYVSFAPPAASIFVLPVKCVAEAAGPRVPTTNERIAIETGSDPKDFQRADSTRGDLGLPISCTVLFRVVQEGSMEPITSGFQVALDTKTASSHWDTLAKDGHMTAFGGGDLHEIKSQSHDGIFRIENAPQEFLLYVKFEKDHDAITGAMPRRCFAPETVLLLVRRKFRQPSGIGEWLWVKSGKYATLHESTSGALK